MSCRRAVSATRPWPAGALEEAWQPWCRRLRPWRTAFRRQPAVREPGLKRTGAEVTDFGRGGSVARPQFVSVGGVGREVNLVQVRGQVTGVQYRFRIDVRRGCSAGIDLLQSSRPPVGSWAAERCSVSDPHGIPESESSEPGQMSARLRISAEAPGRLAAAIGTGGSNGKAVQASGSRAGVGRRPGLPEVL